MVDTNTQFTTTVALETDRPDTLLAKAVVVANIASAVVFAVKVTEGVPLLVTPTQPLASDTV